MIHNPFLLFAPYNKRLDIRFFIKEDSMKCDEDLQTKLHHEGIVSVTQVHGNTTIIARSPSRREKEADGVLTNQKDIWLSIRSADCQSFVIYDPLLEVVGVLHAGWRGLIRGAIPTFFKTMNAEWATDPSRILVGACPALCTACAEFTDPHTEFSGIDPRYFHGRNVDLRGIADQQWMECGIQKDNIERLPDCTRCHPETYWSYRGGDMADIKNGYRNILAAHILQAS